jgi:uncharacterized cupredoxin-like copper-binding protein
MRHRYTASITALLLVLAACGGDGGGGGTTTPTTAPVGIEIEIHGTEFEFDPSTIEVPAGVPVTFVFMNHGVIEHDFTIEAVGLSMYADPGQTVRDTVTFQPGTYEFICTIPGHYESGMFGTLIAE